MSNSCHRSEDACAYVSGDLADSENFARHIANCVDCQNAVESAKGLVGKMRTVPEIELTADFATRVSARIAEEKSGISFFAHWKPALAIAAACALLAAWAYFNYDQESQANNSLAIADGIVKESQSRALDWFVRTQGEDGSWNAERWGGQQNYQFALTALPLLALATADQSTLKQQAAADRAIVHILKSQRRNGRLGSGTPYDHSIATLALLHAGNRWPGSVPKIRLDAAVAALNSSIREDEASAPWRAQALKLAASLGWKSAPQEEHPIRIKMVENVRSLDFYNFYFTVTALRSEPNPETQSQLEALRARLVSQQVESTDEEDGSWPPDDQWGRVGGRLYSTALASMSLHNRE